MGRCLLLTWGGGAYFLHQFDKGCSLNHVLTPSTTCWYSRFVFANVNNAKHPAVALCILIPSRVSSTLQHCGLTVTCPTHTVQIRVSVSSHGQEDYVCRFNSRRGGLEYSHQIPAAPRSAEQSPAEGPPPTDPAQVEKSSSATFQPSTALKRRVAEPRRRSEGSTTRRMPEPAGITPALQHQRAPPQSRPCP